LIASGEPTTHLFCRSPCKSINLGVVVEISNRQTLQLHIPRDGRVLLGRRAVGSKRSANHQRSSPVLAVQHHLGATLGGCQVPRLAEVFGRTKQKSSSFFKRYPTFSLDWSASLGELHFDHVNSLCKLTWPWLANVLAQNSPGVSLLSVLPFPSEFPPIMLR